MNTVINGPIDKVVIIRSNGKKVPVTYDKEGKIEPTTWLVSLAFYLHLYLIHDGDPSYVMQPGNGCTGCMQTDWIETILPLLRRHAAEDLRSYFSDKDKPVENLINRVYYAYYSNDRGANDKCFSSENPIRRMILVPSERDTIKKAEQIAFYCYDQSDG